MSIWKLLVTCCVVMLWVASLLEYLNYKGLFDAPKPEPPLPVYYISSEMTESLGVPAEKLIVLSGGRTSRENILVAYCNPLGGTILAIELKEPNLPISQRGWEATVDISSTVDYLREKITLQEVPRYPDIYVGFTTLNIAGYYIIGADIQNGDKQRVASFGYSSNTFYPEQITAAKRLAFCKGTAPRLSYARQPR